MFQNEFMPFLHFVKQLISDFSRMYSDHRDYHTLLSLHCIFIASSFQFLSCSQDHCSPHCGSSHAISSHTIEDHTFTNFHLTITSPFHQTSLVATAPRRSHYAATATLSEPLQGPHSQPCNTHGHIPIGRNSHQLTQSPYT